MGYGTYLYTSLYFYRKTYKSKFDVEEDLEEVRERIRRAKEDLMRLAYMTEPAKFCVNEESPDSYIRAELKFAVESLEEASVEEYKLEQLLDTWDETHDSEGKAIKPSDEDRKSFICGDFIE